MTLISIFMIIDKSLSTLQLALSGQFSPNLVALLISATITVFFLISLSYLADKLITIFYSPGEDYLVS
jgi:Flp pilus assembly pilin Flp